MRRAFLIVFFTIFCFQIMAQSGPVSTGAKIKESGGTVDFTVGQAVYTPAYGSSGSATMGMQQPFTIKAITGLDETSINLSIVLYPNPTSDYISLKIEKENIDYSAYSFSIYNASGEMVRQGPIIESVTLIPMSDLSSATYFIKAFFSESEVKSFRVIKN